MQSSTLPDPCQRNKLETTSRLSLTIYQLVQDCNPVPLQTLGRPARGQAASIFKANRSLQWGPNPPQLRGCLPCTAADWGAMHQKVGHLPGPCGVDKQPHKHATRLAPSSADDRKEHTFLLNLSAQAHDKSKACSCRQLQMPCHQQVPAASESSESWLAQANQSQSCTINTQ